MRTGQDFQFYVIFQVGGEIEDWIKMRGLESQNLLQSELEDLK
jgi:hypothetical protein